MLWSLCQKKSLNCTELSIQVLLENYFLVNQESYNQLKGRRMHLYFNRFNLKQKPLPVVSLRAAIISDNSVIIEKYY